jgi:hypothetical protein
VTDLAKLSERRPRRWLIGWWHRQQLAAAGKLCRAGKLPQVNYAALMIDLTFRAYSEPLAVGQLIDCMELGFLDLTWLERRKVPAAGRSRDAVQRYGPFLEAPYALAAHTSAWKAPNERFAWTDGARYHCRHARRILSPTVRALISCEAWLTEKHEHYPTIIKLAAFAAGGGLGGWLVRAVADWIRSR